MGGALVNIYSKCGALVLARRVFDMLPQMLLIGFRNFPSIFPFNFP